MHSADAQLFAWRDQRGVPDLWRTPGWGTQGGDQTI